MIRTRALGAVLPLALAAATSGCFGPAAAPTCEYGEIRMIGTLDGERIDTNTPLTGFAKTILGDFALIATFEDGGELRLSWTDPATDGTVVDVGGGLFLPPGTSKSPGYCVGSGSQLVVTQQTGQFLLTSLTADCSTTDDTILGCYAACDPRNEAICVPLPPDFRPFQ